MQLSVATTGINKKDSDHLLFKVQFPQCQAMKKWIEMLNRYDDCFRTHFTAVAKYLCLSYWHQKKNKLFKSWSFF